MNEVEISCDTVVIGAGTAGLAAFKEANARAFTVLIESGPLGTTAQRTGDTPMTLLLEAGRSAHELSRTAVHGVRVGSGYALDTSGVMNALRSVRARATTEVLSYMYRIPEGQRLMGRASFIDDHHVRVGDEYRVTFKTAVIATGSAPVVPYELRDLKGVLTTDNFFDQDRLPEAVAVVGSGSVGLELGQALHNLGVRVAVFGNGRLWRFSDDTVIPVAYELLQESFPLTITSTLTAIEESPSGHVALYYLDEALFENYLEVDAVVAAAARAPRTAGLNLKAAGVELDKSGRIAVDPLTLQTSMAHIFAAGDVALEENTSHVARLTGQMAGRNAATFPVVHRMQPISRLNLLFTEPGLAIVGRTLDEMKERARKGAPFVCSEVRLDGGRFRILRREGGIIRIYTDVESHQILGSELCCTGAEHLAHFLSLCLSRGLTVEEVAAFPCFQPCLEEALVSSARAAVKTLNRKSVTHV